jgi:hypothetical protein
VSLVTSALNAFENAILCHQKSYVKTTGRDHSGDGFGNDIAVAMTRGIPA